MGTRAVGAAAVAFAFAFALLNASQAGAATDRETVAARQLLALVPTEIRPSCRIVDLQQSADTQPLVRYADEISVAVQCVPPSGADVVTYVQASSAARATHLYRVFQPKHRLARTNGPADCEAAETYSLGQGEPIAGHDVCYFMTNVFVGDHHPVAIDWTYAPEALYVRSSRDDGDATALRDWWSEIAGPLQHPQTARIPELQTPAAGRASYRRLLQRLPEAIRSTCHRASLGDDAPPSVAAVRSWVDAAAECHDMATGVDASFLHFTWSAPLDAEFRRVSDAIGGGHGAQATDSSGCPSTGTWQHDGADVGPFVCGMTNIDAGGDATNTAVSYVWADPADRIFALAARSGSDAAVLESWWRQAGPIPT